MYEPLSVESSVSWSGAGSGGGGPEEGVDYSSLSQDEIFEEIQRECAEIEHHSASSSDGPSALPVLRIQNGKALAVRKTTTMKRKVYTGRDSMSSLDSASGIIPLGATAGGRGGGRKERKKELNRG